MAARISWSQEALDDLDAIAEYIARDSLYHARRVVEEAFALADSLIDSPRRGRMVPELTDEGVWELFLYSYRLIYEVGDDEIEVLALIHGKRLLESIEDRFE